MSLRRRVPAVSAAIVTSAALVLSGCSLLPSNTPATRTGAASTEAPDAVLPGTEKFYSQQLVWKSCQTFECSELTVPVDYADPGGATITLALLKAPALGERKGSLVVNPGGPGGSGVDYAASADFIVGAPVRDAYDVVGFDPRGVKRSAPVDCLSDAELDTFLGGDPTPDDAAEQQEFAAGAKAFADACAAKAGQLLAHNSTVDVAKDMEILRAALGDSQLNYLGKSYGTFLGSTYAGLFPRKVGRFVLDGVVPPELTSEQLNLGQAEGFERASRAWAQSCLDEGNCPLGSTVDEVMQGLRDLLKSADASPLPNTGDAKIPALTEGWLSIGIGQAMYSEDLWPQLTDALRAIVDEQDSSVMMDLAYQYADRTPDGTYGSNIMEAIYTVNCLDRPDSNSIPEHVRQAQEATAKAPTWGTFLMWSSMPCGYWPVKATNPPHKITAEGSGLIVVVGTTRDPATPYEWAVMLNDELANSTLITFDGDGHTAYTRSNPCVDDAIDAYYVDGTPPPADLKC